MERNKFNITVKLPFSKQSVRLFEINNRDYLIISKFTQNNDFTGLVKHLKTSIEGFDNIDNIVDKVYALIALRSLFISDEIQVLNKDKAPVTMSLSTILDQLETYKDVNSYDHVVDKFYIKFKPISHLPGDECSIYDCIKSITLFDTEIDGNIEEVLDRLPPNVYSVINTHILKLYNSYKEFTVVPGNEKVRLQPLTINLISEQLQQFIISIYKIDLQNILESVFVFSQHFKNVDFFEMSPLDSRILESILHRELKEANKSAEQHSNPLTPHL